MAKHFNYFIVQLKWHEFIYNVLESFFYYKLKTKYLLSYSQGKSVKLCAEK